jgi:hypothetical protein
MNLIKILENIDKILLYSTYKNLIIPTYEESIKNISTAVTNTFLSPIRSQQIHQH